MKINIILAILIILTIFITILSIVNEKRLDRKETVLKIAYENRDVQKMALDKFSQVEVYAVDENLMPIKKESNIYGIKFCEDRKGCYFVLVDLNKEKVMKIYRLAGVKLG